MINSDTIANWESVSGSGEPKPESGKQGKAGTFVLDAIDTKKGNARIIRESEIGEGANDIQVMATPIGLAFIQIAPGIADITTVFTSHPKPGSKDFIAVESRHISLAVLSSRGLPTPSQCHGTCKG